jgi:hypothetical protein
VKNKGLVLCLSILALGASRLLADVTGSILGVVRDSSTAVVPGVKVTATNLDTNLSQSATTNDAGDYRILALPAGRYKIEASHAGFQTFQSTDIVLNVNDQQRIDVSLQVGLVEQQVTVNAAAVQVETTSTQLGQVINEKSLLSLPLNGRSYIDLLGLQAGVAAISAGGNSRVVSGELAAGNFSVNGQREASNAFLVNGGDVTEGRNFGTTIIPNLDSVAEFRLITNTFDAEYGRFSGAVMNAITKSGTNGFHGSAFEFLRNSDMDARGFFDPTRALLKRNQFGYSVGGPAIRNKLFWFTDYQGTREIAGSSTGLVPVLTSAERQGDFSADPLSGAVSGPYFASVLSQRLGYTVTDGEPYSSVFPGSIIPTRAFSSAAVGTLKFIPPPNYGANNYTNSSENVTTNDDKTGQRVDFINRRTGNWSGYYHYDDSTLINPTAVSPFPGFTTATPSRAQQGVLSNIKIFGPTAVNEFRLNYTRMSIHSNAPIEGTGPVGDFGFVSGGLGIVPSGFLGVSGVPSISLLNFTFGLPAQNANQFNNTYTISDSFSKTFKRHSFKFGGEFRYFQVNDRNEYSPVGNFSFDGSETGVDLADYLIGAPTQYVQSSVQVLDSRSKFGAVYAQDSFRVKPNFTVNYGIRWEVSMPWYDTQGKIQAIVAGEQSVVFPTSPKGWVYPGDPGIPSTLAPTNYRNFTPRLGLAYSPSTSSGLLGKILGGPGKTSIRAAGGLFYQAIQDATLFNEVGDAPFALFWVSTGPVLFEQPYVLLADGSSQVQRFPYATVVPGSPENKTLDFDQFLPLTSSCGYIATNKLPYTIHYNFSIQRQISNSTVASVAYVGSEGHRQIAFMEANPGDAPLCLSLRGSGVMAGTRQCGPNGEDATYTLPNRTLIYGTRDLRGLNPPGAFYWGHDNLMANQSNAAYNAFQASLERKSANFTFLAAYTFSKSLDDASAFGAALNFENIQLGRGLSTFDQTHNFVISYAYALPLDRAFRSAPRRLTQGWSMNGITRFATGLPVQISQSGDRDLLGASGLATPNLVGPLVFQNPRNAGPAGGPHQYFNKSAFATETLGLFGTANRSFFHGSGLNNWDFGLHKDTTIRESMSVQFRAEFFNILDHAQFTNPSGNFASSAFGLVRGNRPARIGQTSLKFVW